MARDVPEKKTDVTDLHYLDGLKVVTNCADCEADIELRTSVLAATKFVPVFLPFTNNEMQQLVLIWLKSLPVKEQGERTLAIVLEMAEEDERREAERATSC